jgi:hypothetical protein
MVMFLEFPLSPNPPLSRSSSATGDGLVKVEELRGREWVSEGGGEWEN